VGAIAALVFILLFARRRAGAAAKPSAQAPLWSYLGGVPGAFAVALGAVSVNSVLGLAGSLSLMLTGQIVFSLVTDRFGLFGTPKRLLDRYDILSALAVGIGSAMIIFGKTGA
jgi:transporter family-2 protein